MALSDSKSDKMCWYHTNAKRPGGREACTASEIDKGLTTVAEQKCHLGCQTYSRMVKIYEASGMPDIFWDYDSAIPDNVDMNAWKTLKNILDNIADFVVSHQNIYLYSHQTGNGKTLWGSRMIKGIIQVKAASAYNTKCIRYVNIPDLVYQYELWDKYSYEDDRKIRFFDNIHTLSDAEFVVWDGFGYSSDTRCEKIVINAIIRSRLNRGLSNMLISDKSPQELSASLGKTFSQQVLNACINIEFKGEDCRKKNQLDYDVM